MQNTKISLYHYFLAVIVTLLWGFNFASVKIALTHFQPFTMLIFRFCIVVALLLPFFPKPPIAFSRLIIISLLFAVGHLGAMFVSLDMGLEASVGIVTLQLHAPFLLLLGIFFFGERIGWRSLLGLILAIFGSSLLTETPNSIEHPLAFWLMVLSALSSAVYSMQLKKTGNVNAVALITWIALCSIPMLLPFAILLESDYMSAILTIDGQTFVALLYTTIGSSIIGHSLWAYLLANNPTHSIAPITLLVPVIGIFAGSFILQEVISQNMLLGTICMIIGVAIIIIRRPVITEIEVEG